MWQFVDRLTRIHPKRKVMGVACVESTVLPQHRRQRIERNTKRQNATYETECAQPGEAARLCCLPCTQMRTQSSSVCAGGHHARETRLTPRTSIQCFCCCWPACPCCKRCALAPQLPLATQTRTISHLHCVSLASTLAARHTLQQDVDSCMC